MIILGLCMVRLYGYIHEKHFFLRTLVWSWCLIPKQPPLDMSVTVCISYLFLLKDTSVYKDIFRQSVWYCDAWKWRRMELWSDCLIINSSEHGLLMHRRHIVQYISLQPCVWSSDYTVIEASFQFSSGHYLHKPCNESP